MRPVFPGTHSMRFALLLSTALLTACGGWDADTAAATPLPAAPALLAAPTLAAQGIKSLHLSWADAPGATSYRLLLEEEGSASPHTVAQLAGGTTSHDLPVWLPPLPNARYRLRACTGAHCVDSAPVVVDSALLDEAVGYFKAPNWRNRAGSSVALSADGGVLAVGVPQDDSATPGIGGDPADTGAPRSGAALVFTRTSGTWTPTAYVKAASPMADDVFGTAVALSADGTTLAVGAPGAAGGVGQVHLFSRSGAGWAAHPPLSPLDSSQPWRFGATLSLSDNGQLLAAGMAPDTAGAPVSGATRVSLFRLDAGGWTLQSQLVSPGAGLSDGFGDALALSGDGLTLVVGARATPLAGGAPDSHAGAAYVFTRVADHWSLARALAPLQPDAFDRFGGAVAVSADGGTIAVGAVGEASNATGVDGDPANAGLGEQGQGAAYVFERSGADWPQRAYIKASNTRAEAQFGWSVALSGDGAVLAVAARDQSGIGRGVGAVPDPTGRPESGAAYLFQRQDSTWRAGRYIKAPLADDDDRFGSSIALSGDGRSLAVGAPGEDSAATGVGGDQSDNSAPGSGAVYLY